MTDILKAIRRAKAMITPAPFLAQSTLFELDRALMFIRDRRQYVGAHPLLWRKATGFDDMPTFVTSEPSWRLLGLPIHDLDGDRARRDEFFGSLAAIWDVRDVVFRPRLSDGI